MPYVTTINCWYFITIIALSTGGSAMNVEKEESFISPGEAPQVLVLRGNGTERNESDMGENDEDSDLCTRKRVVMPMFSIFGFALLTMAGFLFYDGIEEYDGAGKAEAAFGLVPL